MTDGRAGVVEVGCVLVAVSVCVGDVGFEFDVWVEVADVSEGLFPSVECLVDCEVDASSEVSETAIVEVEVVDAGCCDSPGGVDEGMESFDWGEVEM